MFVNDRNYLCGAPILFSSWQQSPLHLFTFSKFPDFPSTLQSSSRFNPRLLKRTNLRYLALRTKFQSQEICCKLSCTFNREHCHGTITVKIFVMCGKCQIEVTASNTIIVQINTGSVSHRIPEETSDKKKINNLTSCIRYHAPNIICAKSVNISAVTLPNDY